MPSMLPSKKIVSLALIASLVTPFVSAAPNFQVDAKDQLSVSKDKWTGHGSGTQSPREPGDSFKRENQSRSYLSHLGLYVGDGLMIEVNIDSAAQRHAAAGGTANRNVLQITPESFMQAAKMESIKSVAPLGRSMSDKIKIAALAKEILLAGANYTHFGAYEDASVRVVCRSGFGRFAGQVCSTQLNVGLYRCDHLVGRAYDRALNTNEKYTYGGFWGLGASPSLIQRRIDWLKEEFN